MKHREVAERTVRYCCGLAIGPAKPDYTVLAWPTAASALRVRDTNRTETALDAGQIFVAVGRRPKTDGFKLQSLQLSMADKAIKIDDQYKTLSATWRRTAMSLLPAF